jgi:hypothetical protein
MFATFWAVDRASESQMRGTSGPDHAERIASASL